MVLWRELYKIIRLGIFLGLAVIQTWANDPCSFSVPPGWNPDRTRWDGLCVGGIAEGIGVLKDVSGKEGDRLFFGRLKNGSLQLGVIDTPNFGAEVGEFKNGRLVEPGDFDNGETSCKAYQVAAKAARAAAARYQKAGNKASEKFYLDKAKLFEMQGN